jgi:ribonucleoside-diphosphate reductase alpha chain
MGINVIKRDGRRVPYDEECIHKIVGYACEGLEGVSMSDIVLHAGIQVYEGITTAEIHDMTIKSAADKISLETPNYQYVAARLAILKIRKSAYGHWEVPSLYDHIKKMCTGGWYDSQLLEKYTKEELDFFDTKIRHALDLKLSYVATQQFEGKYLVQNRVTGEILESPQMSLICITLALFQDFSSDPEARSHVVCEFYKHLSGQDISLPTPIMAGVRTPLKQFSSCVLLECGDSLDSISATGAAIIRYVSQRAGIGINVGQIRTKGAPVRKGAAYHTGITPFIKFFQSAVQSCSAGGIRSGAATVYYPLWHYEVEDMLVLKNNRGIEENRARHLDYGVQINGFLYRRLQQEQEITLFSPHEVQDLHQAFFSDQELFAQLYQRYEKDEKILFRKKVRAVDLFSLLMRERSSTGRIYIMHVDHCNTHSAFDPSIAPIKQSNLCAEITLPTKTLSLEDRSSGEIALCTLAAINLGNIGMDQEKMQTCTRLLVYALDSLIDYQNYPVYESKQSTIERRALGIGVINYATFLAQRDLKFSDEKHLEVTHELFEMFQYYCIKASVELAKLKGPCKRFSETKYAKGILPIDTYYKKGIDKVVTPDHLKMDWEGLRKEIMRYGMRNSTLTALMPSETSSQISNATNGIEPPRALISVKQSKEGIFKQVVPNMETLGHKYELLWTMPNNRGYLTTVGIMQKFVDQSISANTNYDPYRYPNQKIPMQVLLKDLLFAYSLGIKTLYYHNTRDHGSEQEAISDVCLSGACKI